MNPLPTGQRASEIFPRFGLLAFATRFPRDARRRLQIGGAVAQPLEIDGDALEADRVEQTSDFHCVTTWTAPLHGMALRARAARSRRRQVFGVTQRKLGR